MITYLNNPLQEFPEYLGDIKEDVIIYYHCHSYSIHYLINASEYGFPSMVASWPLDEVCLL